jgi:hypothetical protein
MVLSTYIFVTGNTLLSISASTHKKSCICRELNSQAEQADSLIDSIIQVLDIQYKYNHN